MGPAVLSSNLRRIRVAKGLSQGDVAEAAGLSRVGYRNVESGQSAPRVDSLVRVATALDVRLEDLVAPVRTLTKVRFRADKKMTTREELLADVARWLDDYNEIERIVGERSKLKLAPLRKEIRALSKSNRARGAAALVRRKMDLEKNEVIADICGLLEGHGIKVFSPKLASESFFGMSVAESDGGPAIVVNTWERLSVERWIFTAAHELGHLLMHLDAYDVQRSDEDDGQEREADAFASHFLMPDELFQKELNEARGLPLLKLVFKLKRIFRVSWQSVLHRIAENSADRKHVWAQLQKEYYAYAGRALIKADDSGALTADSFLSSAVRPRARAAEEPESLVRADFVEDHLLRLVRQAVEAEEISLGRAAEMLRLDLEAMRELAGSWVQ
jgi:Zn-dependent peptidase ImmA (M78 family)/DNA-binding XRE family transcriptional regulator